MTTIGTAMGSGRPRLFYGWYLVIASWIMMFLMNAVVVGIFFKPMLVEFGYDRATLSAVQSIALIAYAIASPFLGRLIDHFGPKRMIFICTGTQLLSRLFNGMASNIWHLYIARFLYEVRVMPASQVLVNRWFVKGRGSALGILASSMPVGALILPPLSQYLILQWTWRPTMLFWAAVTFALMLPLALFIKDNPEEKGYGPDGKINKNPPPASAGATPSLKPKPGLALLEALKTRTFWFQSTAHFICGIGCGFTQTHIVIFAIDMGYSDMIGASLLSIQGGVNLLGVLATGRLSDRIARGRVLALTHFIRSLSFATIILFVLLGGGSLWILYLAMALFGFGWFTTSPLQAGLVADNFGSLRMGTILSIIISAHTLGWAVGAYAGGIVFEMTGSYYGFFLVQTCLELTAALLAFTIKQTKIPPAIDSGHS